MEKIGNAGVAREHAFVVWEADGIGGNVPEWIAVSRLSRRARLGPIV